MRKLVLLVALGVLAACAPDPLAAPDLTAPLPGPEPSFVFGEDGAYTGGQLVVGLLLKRPAPGRLADLVSKADFEAYLSAEQAHANEDPLEEIEEVVEYVEPSFPLWGERASSLREAADRFVQETRVPVIFREVLAHECDALPLVLLSRWGIHAGEARDLDAYEADGGRVVRRRQGVDLPAALGVALADALAHSPKIHRLASDPLALIDAERVGDEVVLQLSERPSVLTLEDGSGQTVALADLDAHGVGRIRAPDPTLNPFGHRVVARWGRDGLTLVRSWSIAELVGTPERVVWAGQRARVGGTFGVRLHVRNSKTGAPLAGSRGFVTLSQGDATIAQVAYATDAAGEAEPTIEVPPNATTGGVQLWVDNQEVGTVTVSADKRVSLVTDRTLYRQTDTVHTRVMVHRAGDGKPAGGVSVTLKLEGVKKLVTTSAHGIASASFALIDADVGESSIKAQIQGAEARRAFRVKAFERPTFLVHASPVTLTLAEDEAAPVIATARYVNGTPMVGARFEVIESGSATVEPRRGKTDAEGILRLTIGALQHRGGAVVVEVTDAEGRSETCYIAVRRPRSMPATAHPVTDLVLDIPGTLAVTAPGRERIDIEVDGVIHDVALDADGDGTLTATPRADRLRVVLDGTVSTFDVLGPTNDPVLVLDRRVGTVGGSLDGVVVAPKGRVFIDIKRDDVLLRTLHVEVPADEPAPFHLPLDEALAGVLELFVHRRDGDQTMRGTAVRALVTRGRSLTVEATAASAWHRPGSVARVDVAITDADGAPTACALGYWGVDTALLALPDGDLGEGYEDVFDVLGSDAAGQEPLAARIERERVAPRGGPGSFLGPIATDRQRTHALIGTRSEAIQRAAKVQARAAHTARVAALRKAYLEAWNDVPLGDIRWAWTLRGVLDWLAQAGRLDPDFLVDAWGTPLGLWHDVEGYRYDWTSAGPDRTWNTPDDQTAVWWGTSLYYDMPARIRRFHAFVKKNRMVDLDPVEMEESFETDNDMPFEESFGIAAGLTDAPFEGPSNSGTIGLGGGAGGGFSGRSGHAISAYVEEPLHVREDFDPTLCFVPEAIVGPDGIVALDVPLKDSVTTWKLRLVASSANGATGIGHGEIHAGLPLYATPWLASRLTVGDTLDLPVAVRNEQDRPIEASLQLSVPKTLEVLGKIDARVAVPAGGTGAYTFRLRAVAPGTARVTIDVRDDRHADRQERIVHVRPNAREVVAVGNLALTPAAARSAGLALSGPGDVRVDFYPTPLAETMSGFEGLIRAPHG